MSIHKLGILLNIRTSTCHPLRLYNCWIAGIAKINRKIYERQYPVRIVNPKGSSIHAQYPEPIKIIKLPVNLALLSEEERQMLLEKRKPKTKIIIEDELEDDFNENEYLQVKNS